ncbi:MAG: hypothetical protein BMS9Abin08_1671 [Gammaproteobacteria bacterium]|nr:MAG: hypothetical protein BMS9Abin08_1671 [Gammaproteobacteria bacterium]
MYTRSVKTSLKAALMLIGVAIFNPLAVAADAPESFQVVDGIAIYLGVMPAQIIQGHPDEHLEHKMHGGIPTKGHRDHVVVALFDNATGKRIENAEVMGSVMEIGSGSKKKKLEPMKIAGTITYGNYFDMPDNNIYHIKVHIHLPGIKDVVEAQFTHQHFGN